MPPELRKRKAPAAEPAAAPPAKKKGPVAKAGKGAKANGVSNATKIAVGGSINLDGFGGEVETNDGKKTTLKALVDESKAGVVLFTYPRASTPGCTTQVCNFRDAYTEVTSTGFAIYGLSNDSPKANATFKEKQKLPYPLLCDPTSTLISAIGLQKATNGTIRGVFVVDKSGNVLAAGPGSPGGTLEVVKKLIGGEAAPAVESKTVAPTENGSNGTNATDKKDVAQAEVAAQVADTAAKLDSNDVKPAAV